MRGCRGANNSGGLALGAMIDVILGSSLQANTSADTIVLDHQGGAILAGIGDGGRRVRLGTAPPRLSRQTPDSGNARHRLRARTAP